LSNSSPPAAPLPSAADDHRAVAAEFTATVESVDAGSWDVPAPVDGWTARDVVAHLIEWLQSFVEGQTEVEFPPGPGVAEDPAGAWRVHSAAVQAILDDPVAAGRTYEFGHIGPMSLGAAIAMIYTPDVFLHRWDLARATGLDETLDPDRCAAMYEGMLPMDDVLRQSGQYGPKVAVPDDADPQTKLLAFIGRTP